MGDEIVVSNLVMNIMSRGSVKASKSLRETASSMRGLSKASTTATKHTNQLLSSLKRIAMYRVLRTIIKEIGQAFSDGLKHAYAFSQTINGNLAQALDSIASRSMQMKNQLGAALGELIMNLQPMLEALINLVTRVADAFSRLFAVLGGRSTYNKATASTEKWADAAGGAAKAAKEWKKQLLGFDEINKLEAPNDSNGGGKTPDSIGNWEEAPAMMEWARQLREITLNWAKDLNLEPLINSWERLKTAIAGFVSIVDNALYWAYTKVLLPFAKWRIEKSLPAELNLLASAFEFLNAVLEKLAPVFQNFFENIIEPFAKWIGEKYVDAVNKATETFESLTRKVEEANSLGEFISSLEGKEKVIVAIATGILAVSAAIATLKLVKGAIDLVTTAFKLLTSPISVAVLGIAALTLVGIELYQKFDTVKQKFDEVGEKFSEFKERFKEPEYWAELGTAIVEALSTAIGAAIGAIAQTLKDLASEFVNKIKEAIKEKFSEDLNGDGEVSWGDIGGNIFIGILEGIADAVKTVGQWIKDHIFTPFVNGFKEAFGIHSPAEEMKPLGEAIWEGALEGILNKIKDVGEWVKSKVWEPLKTAIKTAFGINTDGGAAENAKTFGESIIEGLKSGIERAWSGIETWFQTTVWLPLESAFNSLLANVSSWAASIQSIWAGVRASASSFNSTVTQHAQDIWDSGEIWNGMNFASGGFPEGDLFIANEPGAGAEMVGRIGNRTAVANNDQIVAAVSAGVASAVSSVMGNGKNDKPIVINVNGREFFRATYNDMQSVTREKGFSLVNA